jgi:glycosyltransferase involved in cell wall biosynthesis
MSKADGPRLEAKLKYFYNSAEGNVLFFHGGARGIIEALSAETRIHPNTLTYFTFPWLLSETSIRGLARTLKRVAAAHPGHDPRKFCFLLNSKAEVKLAKKHLKGLCDFIYFSNSALIKTSHFLSHINTEKDVDAVYNARASEFKRHYLTALIPDKMFLSYEWRREEVDLSLFKPARSFRDVAYGDVAKTIAQAKVGLILSEEEGACYASLEYLLCGLPVVSTPSRGGRDAYYGPWNAIIVEPTEEAVAAGVREALEKLKSGAFEPQQIQQQAIQRMERFRAKLDTHLQTRMREMGFGDAGVGLLAARLAVTTKLWKFRNMWMKQLPETL